MTFSHLLSKTHVAALLLPLLGFLPQSLHAGAFVFAGEGNGLNIVSHPSGYGGNGGTVHVNVCMVETSPFADQVDTAVANAINTWNDMQAVTPNLESANVPSGQFDFESALLHEMGHCIGLAHPNVGVQDGVGAGERNYTNVGPGANNVFDFNDGADNLIGSNDDLRGDDNNLHWFRTADNNPFLVDATVDGSNFSRTLADLPVGQNFAENADRTVGAARGFPNTEAVMQQGQFSQEAQRQLQADDVSTRRFASSGVDRVAGNADDYSLKLVNLGQRPAGDPECDITIEFDNTTSFARCGLSGVLIAANNAEITSATTTYSASANWFFNDVANGPPPDADTDGMPDKYESENGLNPTADDRNGDVDMDGVSNIDEFSNGTLAGSPDSDSDGLGDAIDNDPLNDTNACVSDVTGPSGAMIFNDTAPSGMTTQCASESQITVDGSMILEEPDARLELFSPNVLVDSGVNVPIGTELDVNAVNPVPGAAQ